MAVKKKIIKLKTKPIKTIEIEISVSKYFGIRQNIIVPNISWGLLSHEVDLLVVRKSGIAIEIEIKISLQDFKADFKKQHHHQERLNRITEFYYAMPETLYEKCKDLIPPEAGILTCNRGSWEGAKVYVKKVRRSIRIKNAKKLTTEEQFKVAQLGCLRIMPLKEKIVNLTNKLSII